MWRPVSPPGPMSSTSAVTSALSVFGYAMDAPLDVLLLWRTGVAANFIWAAAGVTIKLRTARARIPGCCCFMTGSPKSEERLVCAAGLTMSIQKLARPGVATRSTDCCLNRRLYSPMIATIAESVTAEDVGCTISSTKLGSWLDWPLGARHSPSAAQNVKPPGSRELTTSRTKTAHSESVTPSVLEMLRPKYRRSVTTGSVAPDRIVEAQPQSSNKRKAWRRTLQPTAFCRSAPILASSVAVNAFNAKATGHMAPSSRFALSLKPSVAYLVLNFCALWKWHTTLPSLAYAGIPYPSR